MSDFAVFIAVITMTLIDAWLGLDTPKLTVPEDIKVRVIQVVIICTVKHSRFFIYRITIILLYF